MLIDINRKEKEVIKEGRPIDAMHYLIRRTRCSIRQAKESVWAYKESKGVK